MIAQARSRPTQRVQPPKRAESRRAPSLVPGSSLAGNALTVIIAIMTFLASLTVGAVGMVRESAETWQSQVLREVTIQIIPAEGRDTNGDIRRAVEIASATPGIAAATPYTDADITRLLEPWLGKDISLTELPAPRLIALRIAPEARPDLAALSDRLAAEVPGATVDDHRAWLDRLKITGNALAGFGVAILILVLSATALSVLFATRSAVSGNRDVVEVLHVCGARDSFIARAFGRRFLGLGLRGGLIGGGMALLLFALTDFFGGRSGDPGVEVMFGGLDVSLAGYGSIIAVAAFTAALTAATSRLTVTAHLRRLS